MYFKGVELTKLKAIKYCSDSTCTNLVPICCLFISSQCSDISSKWHHLSAGEHVCSVCYNYLHSFFSYESENADINTWKQSWLTRSHETPTIFDYITSTLLSNWYSCVDCGKWRQISRDMILSASEIERYNCGMTLQHTQLPCQVAEDERVEFVRNHPGSYFESVKYAVYLAGSPYLNVYDDQSLDLIGICPAATKSEYNLNEPCEGFMTRFNPFCKDSNLQVTAGAIDAASMDKWEYEYFPTFTGTLKPVFIGVRNLMLMLWAANPKRAVTCQLMGRCVQMRGLTKVALLVNCVPDMIRIYSGFGYVNYGFPEGGNLHLIDEASRRDVVVVGAGLSGLAAAHHLRLMGASVTVLEANKSLLDETGKQLPMKLKTYDCLNEVYGATNNPFSVMANQCDIVMRDVSTNLSIFTTEGDIIADDVDQFFQNLVYNFVAYLMEGSSIIKNSSNYEGWSLADLYRDYRRNRLSQQFADSERVEDVYLAEIEYRVCGGASMENISRDIDMPSINRGIYNFSYKQFSGATIEPADNWNPLLHLLTSQADIRYASRVKSIGKNSNTDKYVLTTSQGQFEADKVLLAMSPWNCAKIAPAISADDWLGNRDVVAGLSVDDPDSRAASTFVIVQMAYDCNNLFWRDRIPCQSSERAFAIVPDAADQRGFCHLFKETRQVDGMTMLQTRIFGLAATLYHDMSDEDIISKVLDKLAVLWRHTDQASGPPRPSWYEIIKIENALLSSTDTGIKFSKLDLSDQFRNDIYVTNKTGVLAEPISLSNSFCIGMDAASAILKQML